MLFSNLYMYLDVDVDVNIDVDMCRLALSDFYRLFPFSDPFAGWGLLMLIVTGISVAALMTW